jgi:hypothetical protein
MNDQYKVNVSEGLEKTIGESASKGSIPAADKAAFVEQTKKIPGVYVQVNEATHEIDVMKVLNEG